VLQTGHHFHKTRLHFSRYTGLFESRERALHIRSVAFAAFLFVLNVTGRFGALELTFGPRTSRGFGTRPAAGRLFT
jgi:hypothetical protein